MNSAIHQHDIEKSLDLICAVDRTVRSILQFESVSTQKFYAVAYYIASINGALDSKEWTEVDITND